MFNEEEFAAILEEAEKLYNKDREEDGQDPSSDAIAFKAYLRAVNTVAYYGLHYR